MGKKDSSVVKNNEIEALDGLVNCIGDIKKIEQWLGGGFNFFSAAGMGSSEVRHCRFLAFLLNPAAAHNTGDLFLRALLMECINDNVVLATKNRTDIYLADLSAAVVRTEVYAGDTGRIDVLIDIPPASKAANRWVILIEAKINASEGENQTTRYVEWAKKNYPESACDVTYLYLAKDEDAPESDEFQMVSWDTVGRSIKSVLDEHRDKISNDVKICIQHYLNLMKEQDIVKDDPDTKLARELALKLYQTHKQAFEFIYKVNEISLAPAIRDVMSGSNEFVLDTDLIQSMVRIYPRAIENIKGVDLQKNWTSSKRPIYIELSSNKGERCKISLVVGPLTDQSLRQKLIEALVHLLPMKVRPKQIEKLNKNYAHVWSVREPFMGDAEQSPNEYATAVRKLLEESILFTRLEEWTTAVNDIFQMPR